MSQRSKEKGGWVSLSPAGIGGATPAIPCCREGVGRGRRA